VAANWSRDTNTATSGWWAIWWSTGVANRDQVRLICSLAVRPHPARARASPTDATRVATARRDGGRTLIVVMYRAISRPPPLARPRRQRSPLQGLAFARGEDRAIKLCERRADPSNMADGTDAEAHSGVVAPTASVLAGFARRSRSGGVLTVVVLALLLSAGTAIVGLVNSFYLEGTSGELYKAWVNGPSVRYGGLGFLICAFGLGLSIFFRRRRSGFVDAFLVAIAITAVSLVAVAHWEVNRREHPVPEERSLAAFFPLARRYGVGVTTVTAATSEGFGVTDPPITTRTWRVHASYVVACSDVLAAIHGWSGAVLHVQTEDTNGGVELVQPNENPPSLVAGNGEACNYIFDASNGWPMFAMVNVRPTQPYDRQLPNDRIPAEQAVIELQVQTPQ